MADYTNQVTNDVMSGTEGDAWINGDKILSIKKLNAKITADFAEEKECGNYSNLYVYNGWKGDGTLVINKKESYSLKLIGDQFLTGDVKPIKLLSTVKSKAKNATESVALWIIFKEFNIIDFEAKVNMEEEIPFSICSYEILSTI